MASNKIFNFTDADWAKWIVITSKNKSINFSNTTIIIIVNVDGKLLYEIDSEKYISDLGKPKHDGINLSFSGKKVEVIVDSIQIPDIDIITVRLMK